MCVCFFSVEDCWIVNGIHCILQYVHLNHHNRSIDSIPWWTSAFYNLYRSFQCQMFRLVVFCWWKDDSFISFSSWVNEQIALHFNFCFVFGWHSGRDTHKWVIRGDASTKWIFWEIESLSRRHLMLFWSTETQSTAKHTPTTHFNLNVYH